MRTNKFHPQSAHPLIHPLQNPTKPACQRRGGSWPQGKGLSGNGNTNSSFVKRINRSINPSSSTRNYLISERIRFKTAEEEKEEEEKGLAICSTFTDTDWLQATRGTSFPKLNHKVSPNQVDSESVWSSAASTDRNLDLRRMSCGDSLAGLQTGPWQEFMSAFHSHCTKNFRPRTPCTL